MGVKFERPRRLDPTDDVSNFSCGKDPVDAWFRERAQKARLNGTAVVYVCLEKGTSDIAGFYSLSAQSIPREDVSGGWLKRNTPPKIPVILLGMLGVDERFKGRGLSRKLVHDALSRSLMAADLVGAKALVIEPIDKGAREYWLHLGFREIPDSDVVYTPLRVKRPE